MLKRALIALIPILLLLGLLNNMALAQVVPVATLIPSVFPSPTTYYVTTAIASPTPGCAAPLPLVNGATAYVKGGVYVRYQPNVSSPFVNYYTEAVTVTVIGGPVCDGVKYNWWQIKGPGNDGWVSEGMPGIYLMRVGVLPATCDPAVNLIVGKRAQLLRDLNVHDQPSEDGLVLTVASTGAMVDVIEGPSCTSDFNYWKIRVTVLDVVYTGWVADGQPGGNDWLISEDALNAPVCDSPLELSVGTQAYVNYKDHIPKILRRGPSKEAELVATLFDGIGFTIIGGPFCAEGYNWWQISILSRPDVTGWLAEGGPSNYWISPIDVSDRPL